MEMAADETKSGDLRVVFGRLAGQEDVNDADRVGHGLAMRRIVV